MKKQTKIDFPSLSPTDLYKLVLNGTLKRFPKHYWEGKNPEAAIEIIRFMFEKILCWSEDEIKNGLNQKIFRNNKLGGMLGISFQDSPYQAFNSAYPDKYKQWELSVPQNYWNLETAKQATRWLLEKLAWTNEAIKANLCVKTFAENGLSGMLRNFYNSSPYEAVNSAFPDRFFQWELYTSPKNYWDLDTGIQSTKWLINILGWSEDDIKANLCKKTFKEYGLDGMLQAVYNSSPFEAINSAYPNIFYPWELSQVPQRFWNLESGIEATKWLVEKVSYKDRNLYHELTIEIFKQFGLYGMLQAVFKSNAHRAILAAYPEYLKKT